MSILEKFKGMNSRVGSYARKQLYETGGVISWSHGSRFEMARTLARPFAGQKLLDYGCGDGTFLTYVSDLVPDAVGTDINPTQIPVGDDKNFFVLSDDFRKSHQRHFDVAFCMEVIEHCGEADADQVLRDLFMFVKPGGRVVISVPNEIGLSLLAKEFFRTLAAFRKVGQYEHKENYRARELFKMVFAGKRSAIPRPLYQGKIFDKTVHYHGHKGFNWKSFQHKLEQYFEVERREFSPLPALKSALNSQVWFVLKRP